MTAKLLKLESTTLPNKVMVQLVCEQTVENGFTYYLLRFADNWRAMELFVTEDLLKDVATWADSDVCCPGNRGLDVWWALKDFSAHLHRFNPKEAYPWYPTTKPRLAESQAMGRLAEAMLNGAE